MDLIDSPVLSLNSTGGIYVLLVQGSHKALCDSSSCCYAAVISHVHQQRLGDPMEQVSLVRGREWVKGGGDGLGGSSLGGSEIGGGGTC